MNRYKLLRQSKHISQATLAKNLGISQTAVSQWETDKNYPDTTVIKKLAEIYSVTTDYLLGLNHVKMIKENAIVVYSKIYANPEWPSISEQVGYEELGSNWIGNNKSYIGYLISDNELSPVFIKDDLLIIELKDTCDDGQFTLIQMGDHDAEICHVYVQANGILVQPILPEQRGHFYPNTTKEKIRIIGVVRQMRRPL